MEQSFFEFKSFEKVCTRIIVEKTAIEQRVNPNIFFLKILGWLMILTSPYYTTPQIILVKAKIRNYPGTETSVYWGWATYRYNSPEVKHELLII